jgi:pSer/pThr/pTyr-binding forkhead associated (FHA) protein
VFKLTIEDDEGKTTVVPLARDEMTIGRLEGNTIRLTERNISRRHARLSQQNGGALFIEDLTSFTGVRVNGTRIASPTPLREGDEVQIGDYRIVLRGEQQPSVIDRPTMPSMPAITAPLATVGGAVAIPGRASVAAMAAQAAAPQAAAVGPAPAAAPVGAVAPPPRPRVKTSPPSPLAAAAPQEAAPQEAAPEVVEGQPTIPLRVIAPDGQPGAGPAARMLVLTTDLAGTEFKLDKASLVIGRTDENEVVLNHRSISRHHAKVVREGEHYTIVDLQSANGVRVNGEDYERIELNPGDVVELGHVKLRFIGPLEQFVFDPRAPIGSRPFPLKLVAAAGGIAVVALAALFFHRSHPSAPAVAEAVAPPPPPAEAVAAPPAPAAPAPSPPPPPPPSTPASILAAVKQSVADEDWEAARVSLERIGGVEDPGMRREVAALARRIATERQGASLFAKFDEAANSKNYAEALAGFERIPSDSVYKKRAQPRYEEARSLLVAEHLESAERARAAGRCAEVRAEAQAVIRLEPHNLLVRDMARLCRAKPEPVASTGRRARASATPAAERAESPRRPELTRSEPPHPEAVATAEPDDADALMKQAREAWLRQQCGSAMDLSRKALRAKPGLTDAYQILAVCSCSLKDADAAGRAYARLDDKNRSLVHALCQKNGIAVGE